MSMFSYFKALVVMMIFWSFAITLYSHYLPESVKPYVAVYLDSGEDTNSLTGEISGTLDNQLNLPILEVGALVYYSSNFVIDLLVNFIFAVPEMIGLLFSGFLYFIPMDTYLNMQITLLVQAAATILYVLGLLAFISNYRSGNVLV